MKMSPAVQKAATRDAYGRTLVALGKENRDIVVLDADLSGSTRTGWFAKEFPDRFFNVGIAEENLITVAAGLATCGKIAFTSTFAVFATERAYNQIRQTAAYPKLNVKIVCTHSGITVGPDGTSHQTIFDVAIMRALPNMTVLVPADATETAEAIKALVAHDGPAYVRLGRTPVPLLYEEGYTYQGKPITFQLGKSTTLRSGDDLTIIANGIMVFEAMDAAEQLSSEGIEARVLNVHTVKPIDEAAILKAAQETGCLVTAEEHSLIGGLGAAVAEILVRKCPVPVEMVGVNDIFTESGTDVELQKIFGLTSKEIVAAARKVVKRK